MDIKKTERFLKNKLKEMDIFKLNILIICLVSLISCSKVSADKVETTGLVKVKLQQQWFPNAGFAGELYAQEYLDEGYGIDLEVLPGSDKIKTIDEVKLGRADFGVAGAEQIMQANEYGNNLTVIGVINFRALAVFISKQEKHIFSPKDFEKKLNQNRKVRVGTMKDTPVDIIFQLLLKENKIDTSKFETVPTNWTLDGFLNDQYDVYPAFINDEPITLKLRDNPIHVNLIKPYDYHVRFIGTVYFCKQELIDKNPALVQNFINAISAGWERVLDDQEKALKLLKDYCESNNFLKKLDIEKEKVSLSLGLRHYRGENEKVLYAKKETWNDMGVQLKKAGLLKHDFNYDKTVNNKFVAWYQLYVKK